MAKTYKKLSVIKHSAVFHETVQVVSVPLVDVKDDQVLIRTVYAGVNAIDSLLSAGRALVDKKDFELPHDLGFDAVGVIEAVGKSVTNLKKGQSVFVHDWPPRAFAEFIYANSEELVVLPELKPDYIALRSGLTATIALEQAGHIASKDKVLITSATGGTGHICVQWAKNKGCHVIGMTTSANKAKILKDLGCDFVINYKRDNVDAVLTEKYPTGIDVIWETLGGRVSQTLFRHLAVKGRFLIVGGIGGYKTSDYPDISFPINPNDLMLFNRTLIGFRIEGFRELYKDYFKLLIDSIANNKLKIILDFGESSSGGPFVGLESVDRAVQHLYKRKTCGKAVITIDKNKK